MKRITLLLTAGALMVGMTVGAQNPERDMMRQERKMQREMRQVGNEVNHEMRRGERAMKHEMRHEMNTMGKGHKGTCGEESVKVLSYKSTRVGEMINLDWWINYDKIFLNPKEQYVVTPYLQGNGQMMYLPPVAFVGDKCYKKMMKQEEKQFGMMLTDLMPFETVVMTNKDMRERRRQQRQSGAEWVADSQNSVAYQASFPYEMWMDGAKIKLHHALTNCNSLQYEYTSTLGTIYNPMPPQVMLIVPEVEVVKARSESMTARLVFKVNKSNIDPNIFNNANELESISKFTENLLNNSDVKITGVHLVGYASPEGPYDFNAKLSIARVNALKDWLQKTYPGIDSKMYTVDNVPEDWDSVRNWVMKSDLTNRDQIIEIIDNNAPDARDAKIRALDKGKTFQYLLENVYPGLRRAVYTIDFTVLPFTVEKGKMVMMTNPQYLSLNEFYQIAVSYPMDSPEYMQVMEMAVRYFPNDPVANNNMAAMALQNNDLPTATMYLERISDFPAAQNNMGVLKALQGDVDAAEQYFKNAMEQGSKEAEYNLQNINSLRQTGK